MYSSIGGKLKGIAVFLAIVGTLLSIVYGILLFNQESSYISSNTGRISGWIVMLVSAFLTWVVSMLIFGFGELIENTQAIQEILRRQQSVAAPYNRGIKNSKKPWACSNCGYVNVGNTSSCSNCGKR